MEIVKRLGSFGIPLMYLLAGFTLYGKVAEVLPGLGFKAASIATFIAFLLWAIWHLSCVRDPRVLGHSGESVRLPKHTNKIGRVYAYAVPSVIAVLAFLPWLEMPEPDYSEYFKQGSGFGQGIVVFDSNPRGDSLRLINKLYYSEKDPFLLEENEHVLEDSTVVALRLGQGYYWAVFELNGHLETQDIVVTGDRVVMAEFEGRWLNDLRPFAVAYAFGAFVLILAVVSGVSFWARRRCLFMIRDAESR